MIRRVKVKKQLLQENKTKELLSKLQLNKQSLLIYQTGTATEKVKAMAID
jgi:hypothetical protein